MEGHMKWKIGPWREIELLRERLQYYDGWLASTKADRDMWRAEWGQTGSAPHLVPQVQEPVLE